MSKIGILEKTKCLSIILALKDKEKSLSELTMEIRGSTNTIDSRLIYLTHKGILIDESEKKYQGKRILTLTDKGKQIAEKLKDIEIILST
jgi:DNA-binding HxlR family transcriptional regulator